MGYVPFSLWRPVVGVAVRCGAAGPAASVLSAVLAAPCASVPGGRVGWFSDFVHSQI